jgi:hypothetical protein
MARPKRRAFATKPVLPWEWPRATYENAKEVVEAAEANTPTIPYRYGIPSLVLVARPVTSLPRSRMVFQPLPGVVCTQLFPLSVGGLGPK